MVIYYYLITLLRWLYQQARNSHIGEDENGMNTNYMFKNINQSLLTNRTFEMCKIIFNHSC